MGSSLSLVKDKKAIEAVQKFTLNVVTSRWDGGYEELMQLVDLQPLEERRVEMKLGLRLFTTSASFQTAH